MSSSAEVIGSISETSNTGEFEWMINNCSEKVFEIETVHYLSSPAFSFSFCSWYIRMYPNGNESSCEEYISLFLYKNKKQPAKCVAFSLVMTIQEKELRNCNDGKFDFFKKDEDHGWGYKKYILRKEVLDHLSKETKSCSLTIKTRLEVFYHEEALLEEKTKDIEILCQNFKDLLLQGKESDLVVKVKEKEFKAHRNIMQCRCPIFITNIPNNNGVVEIPDCDPNVFEQFLIYVYTGDLDILDENNMLGLYIIAKKYEMVHLKEKCCGFIKKSLSTHNVGDVMGLALDHSDESLLKFATEYFMKNVKDILVTVGWQSFIKEHPIQANELFLKTVNNQRK